MQIDYKTNKESEFDSSFASHDEDDGGEETTNSPGVEEASNMFANFNISTPPPVSTQIIFLLASSYGNLHQRRYSIEHKDMFFFFVTESVTQAIELLEVSVDGFMPSTNARL